MTGRMYTTGEWKRWHGVCDGQAHGASAAAEAAAAAAASLASFADAVAAALAAAREPLVLAAAAAAASCAAAANTLSSPASAPPPAGLKASAPDACGARTQPLAATLTHAASFLARAAASRLAFSCPAATCAGDISPQRFRRMAHPELSQRSS